MADLAPRPERFRTATVSIGGELTITGARSFTTSDARTRVASNLLAKGGRNDINERNSVYKIAAVLFLLFTAGHIFRFLSFRPSSPEGRAVFESMNRVFFDVGERGRSPQAAGSAACAGGWRCGRATQRRPSLVVGKPEDEAGDSGKQPDANAPPLPGHGRNGAEAFHGAGRVEIKHQTLGYIGGQVLKSAGIAEGRIKFS
jgi:hypothetical protein